jgi:hypothetical protein
MAEIIPPRRGEELTPHGSPTRRFSEYLERLASSVNSGSSEFEIFASLNISAASIAALSKQIQDLDLAPDLSATSQIASLKKQIADLEQLITLSMSGQLSSFQQELKVVTITANYTSNGNEIIICNNTSKITVTMTASPPNGSRTYIKRANAIVDVTATKGIDGKTTKKIINKYDSPLLVYTSQIDEYSVI